MSDSKFMWCYFIDIGHNMWSTTTDYLRCDKHVWDEAMDCIIKSGCNTVVINMAEGLIYDSHPEIAVKGSWTKNQLYDEIAKLKSHGIEVIPHLNFSTGHSMWLGEYRKMTSTQTYYKVCDDLIDEMCELFEKPRLFFLGMDEECYSIQKKYQHCIIREGDLYWHDQDLLFKRAQKNGARPWIAADYVWHNKEREKTFLERMSKDVLLSNWYYHDFRTHNDWHDDSIAAYKLLDDHGFEQAPMASNFVMDENLECTIKYVKENLSKELIKGICVAQWNTTEKNRDKLIGSINVLGESIKKHGNDIYK